MWTRPSLCRLCQCPASDGSVPVDQLDTVKLSKWWRRTIDADFEIYATLHSEDVICSFCIWDAKLLQENCEAESSSGHDECNWWLEHENNNFFKQYYYEEAVILQCKVQLEPAASLPNSQSTLDHKKKLKLQCFLCDQPAFSRRQSLVLHMRSEHAGQFFECYCSKVFQTEEEKEKHILKSHKPQKKCDFCHRKYTVNLAKHHMQTYHAGDNLIGCSYKFCHCYFRSEEAKQKHEQLIHAAGEKMTNCIFCGLLFKCMKGHLRSKHKQQLLTSAFKCTEEKCLVYFLTEEERDQHVAKVHSKTPVLRKEVKCIYCKKMCKDKYILKAHVDYFHYEFKIICEFKNCGRYFFRQARADAHYERMHRNKEKMKVFQCTKCNFKSARKDGLKMHENLWHGEKTIPCPRCDKLFSSMRSLKSHLGSTHTDASLCEHCNGKFKSIQKHQQQEKCNKCQQILLCCKLARMHDKACNKKNAENSSTRQQERNQEASNCT